MTSKKNCMKTRADYINIIKTEPVRLARAIGFSLLGDLHNEWLKDFVYGSGDITKQASRNTYKTTSVAFAIAMLMATRPNKKILFLRKTDGDIKEVIRTIGNILQNPKFVAFVYVLTGSVLRITTQNASEITTNLCYDIRGTAQLTGQGIGGSLTGKHFDYIFTDDIVNREDRVSRAERERTKAIYQELQNIKIRGGRIINTGTPWHPDDAFSIMPEAEKYDCYHDEVKKIIDETTLQELKESMEPALFAVNYELRHIPSEAIIFNDPKEGASPDEIRDGTMQIDAAYSGEDYTAWSIMARKGDKYYLYGQIRRKHIEECYGEIMRDYERFLSGKAYMEDNADKGFSAKELRKLGMRVVTYTETMNKHIKIVTHLKAIWKNVVFVEGTDEDYIDQICDYFEDADHDDAPDSAASLSRILYKPRREEENTSIWS